MRKKSSKTLIALASAAAFWAAAVPAHASPTDVIRDCSQDGRLNRHYTEKELVGALRKLPSDVDEYTDCRGIIRRAQLAGANKGGWGPGQAAGETARTGMTSTEPIGGSEQ